MKHNDLITEVTKQLAPRFQPQPMEIKKRIESLIEVAFAFYLDHGLSDSFQKEFLDRDKEDKRAYQYLVSYRYTPPTSITYSHSGLRLQDYQH